MAKAKASKLVAWEVIKSIERSRKEKDLFFDLSARAYERNPKKTMEIRKMLASEKITLDQALKELEKIAEG